MMNKNKRDFFFFLEIKKNPPTMTPSSWKVGSLDSCSLDNSIKTLKTPRKRNFSLEEVATWYPCILHLEAGDIYIYFMQTDTFLSEYIKLKSLPFFLCLLSQDTKDKPDNEVDRAVPIPNGFFPCEVSSSLSYINSV